MNRKKCFSFVLAMLSICFIGMAGCAPSYDEIAWESMDSEETETEDAYRGSDSVTITPIEDAVLSFSAGFSKEDPDDEINITYTGDTMEIPFEIEYDAGDIPNFGVLLFLDGYLQPFSIPEQDTEEAYLQIVDAVVGEKKEFTIAFTPVTGAEGEILEASILVITNPDYMPDPESPVIYFMANAYGCLSCVYPITFQADPPSDGDETFPDSSYSALSFTSQEEYVTEEVLTEYWGEYGDDVTMEEYESMYYYKVQTYIDGIPIPIIMNNHMQMVDISGKDTIHITCQIIGPVGACLQTAFFLDGTPIALSDPSVFTYATDAKKGKMDVLEFDLDTSELKDASTFCVVTVPRNSYSYEGNILPQVQDPVLLYRQ